MLLDIAEGEETRGFSFSLTQQTGEEEWNEIFPSLRVCCCCSNFALAAVVSGVAICREGCGYKLFCMHATCQSHLLSVRTAGMLLHRLLVKLTLQ